MKKLNSAAIDQKINAIPNVCADGRKAIRGLIAEVLEQATGEKLEEHIVLRAGDKWDLPGFGICVMHQITSTDEWYWAGTEFKTSKPINELGKPHRTHQEMISHIRAHNGVRIGHCKIVDDQ